MEEKEHYNSVSRKAPASHGCRAPASHGFGAPDDRSFLDKSKTV
jgi:hypothetical protein